MHTCIKCLQPKPPSEFYARSSRTSGVEATCKVCKLAANARWRAENRERMQELRNAWHAENRSRMQALNAAWYVKNKDRKRQAVKQWSERNPSKRRAIEARRRAAELRAMPPWADREAIRAVYAEQQRCLELGLDVHVDHIVPLQGKTVCGLHVHWNLQLLLATDNRRKHSKLNPRDALAFVESKE